MNPRSIGYDRSRTAGFLQRLDDRAAQHSRASAASASPSCRCYGNEWDNGITIEGYHAKPGEDVDPHFNAVGPGYLRDARQSTCWRAAISPPNDTANAHRWSAS